MNMVCVGSQGFCLGLYARGLVRYVRQLTLDIFVSLVQWSNGGLVSINSTRNTSKGEHKRRFIGRMALSIIFAQQKMIKDCRYRAKLVALGSE